MDESRLSPHPHPFDLNSMMSAIPTRTANPKEHLCFIHRMANEILVEIFEWLLHMPRPRMPALRPGMASRPTLANPILVSHVCNRWRGVVSHLTSQWTHLEIHSARHPDIFAEFMGRSKQFPVSLSIMLPALDIERRTDDRKIEFKTTMKTLKSHAHRIQYLHIQSNNATFMLMFNRFLKNVNFSALETLILKQVIPHSRTYEVGPVVFNPAVFRTLRLENIVIECNAPCLAGLHVLHAINTSGTILDQTQLPHATYPMIPEGPTMNNLRDLVIDKTNIIPTHPHPTPSFSSASLRKLTLAHIRVPTIEARGLVLRLFHITYSPLLEILILDTLELEAFNIFVGFLASPVPKLACVRRLILANMQFSHTIGMVDMLRLFLKAFPRVEELHLVAVSLTPMLRALTDTTLMPLLMSINADHQRLPRIPAPPRLPLAPAPST